jgi:hypothetical protein
MTSGSDKQSWDPSQSDPTKLTPQQLETAKSQGHAVFVWPKDLRITKQLFAKMSEDEQRRAAEIVLKVKKGLLLPPAEHHFVQCFVQYWQQKLKTVLARDPKLKEITDQDGLSRAKYNWPVGCRVTEDLAGLGDIEKDRIIRAQKGELITMVDCKEVDKWLGMRMLRKSLSERPDPLSEARGPGAGV